LEGEGRAVKVLRETKRELPLWEKRLKKNKERPCTSSEEKGDRFSGGQQGIHTRRGTGHRTKEKVRESRKGKGALGAPLGTKQVDDRKQNSVKSV